MPDPLDDIYARDSRHHQDRPAPPITLRSRSRSQDGKKTPKAQKAPLERATGVQLYPRAQFETSSAMTSHAYREQSQSEAESAQVAIPLRATLDQPDWTRSSQERERPEDDEAAGEEMIPIPTTQSLEEDWKISVQKAFADPTRTKAPCEIPEANTLKLVNTVSKRQYDSFVRVLRSRNYSTTPQEVIGNMASIFAQSGKMSIGLRLRDPTPLKFRIL